MSSVATGPKILGAKGTRSVRKSTALNLPTSPSAAFEVFIDPFESRKGEQRTFRKLPGSRQKIAQQGSRAQRSLSLFNSSDFRLGSKGGRNLRGIFNVRAREFNFGGKF